MRKQLVGVIESVIKKGDSLLSTGSTMLNLALTDNPYGGYPKGCLVNVVGDSSSGKTFLCLNTLAEAVCSSAFEKYMPKTESAFSKYF